jgi:hypothetical protein
MSNPVAIRVLAYGHHR